MVPAAKKIFIDFYILRQLVYVGFFQREFVIFQDF